MSYLSMGDALAEQQYISAEGIKYLRQAFGQVTNAAETQSTTKLGKPFTSDQVTKVIKKAVKKTIDDGTGDLGGFIVEDDDDTYQGLLEYIKNNVAGQDEEPKDDTPKPTKPIGKLCALEKATICAPTKSAQDSNCAAKLAAHLSAVGDDVLGRRSAAVQKLLLCIFSVNGVENVVSVAHWARENAATLSSTVALARIGNKQRSHIASPDARMFTLHSFTYLFPFTLLYEALPKRPASASSVDGRKKTTLKLRKDVEDIVRDHFRFVNDNPSRIHEKVVSYVQKTTVAEFSEKVIDGMPEFLQRQLNEDNVDLDVLAARVAMDLELQPTTGKRGTYVLLGRPRGLAQTTIALPATTVSGVWRSSRNRNPEQKWALYGAKRARWKGIPTRANRYHQGLTGEQDL